MIWLGLTGTIGSGKSTVASLLLKRGKPVLDADHFARQAIGPGTPGEAQVLTDFGSGIADQKGGIDRQKLAAQVFGDSAGLARLEAIVHPIVKQRTIEERQALEKLGTWVAFYDVPLLFEKKMESQFDGIVVVWADPEVCIQRVVKRSQISRVEVESRLKTQLAVAEKIKRAHWLIDNNGSLLDLEKSVDQILLDIGRRFST